MSHKRVHPHTLEEIKNACKVRVSDGGQLLEVCQISEELDQGLDILARYKRLVTIYGSAQFDMNVHPMCKAAEELAGKLVREAEAGIITGGGPGIMGAANKGAFLAHGNSLGATIVIPSEQTTNPYVNQEVPFQYFFTRKTALRFGAEMAIYFPGGYGTLDELFELLNLIKTNKIARTPVILFGSEFWNPLNSYMESVLETAGTILPEDRNIYLISDNIDEIVDIAKSVPPRDAKIEK